jgi:hypothetical protein
VSKVKRALSSMPPKQKIHNLLNELYEHLLLCDAAAKHRDLAVQHRGMITYYISHIRRQVRLLGEQEFIRYNNLATSLSESDLAVEQKVALIKHILG